MADEQPVISFPTAEQIDTLNELLGRIADALEALTPQN